MKKQSKKMKAKTPFFAHLLTKHEMQRTAAGSGPATPYATAKDPSDKDESIPALDAIVSGRPPSA